MEPLIEAKRLNQRGKHSSLCTRSLIFSPLDLGFFTSQQYFIILLNIVLVFKIYHFTPLSIHSLQIKNTKLCIKSGTDPIEI